MGHWFNCYYLNSNSIDFEMEEYHSAVVTELSLGEFRFLAFPARRSFFSSTVILNAKY
jgi:hypothetical protein